MPLKRYSRYVAMFAVAGTAAMGTAQAVQPAGGAAAPAAPTVAPPAVPTAPTAPAAAVAPPVAAPATAPAGSAAPAPAKAVAPASAAAPAPAPAKPVSQPSSFVTTASVSLNGTLAAGDFKLLADITPFNTVRGHVALKAPCGKKLEMPLVLLAGVAPAVVPVNLAYVEALSNPGQWCLYHGDLGAGITDVALKNGGAQPVAFKDNAGYSVTVTLEASAAAPHVHAEPEAAKAPEPVEAPPAPAAVPAPAAPASAQPAAATAPPAAPAPAPAPAAVAAPAVKPAVATPAAPAAPPAAAPAVAPAKAVVPGN